MPDEKEMQEAMKKFLDDMVENFSDHTPSRVKQVLEAQEAILHHYQRNLDSQLSHDPVTEHMDKMAKMLISSYMEIVKVQRESRQRFLEVQSNMVKSYLDMVSGVLGNMDSEKKS